MDSKTFWKIIENMFDEKGLVKTMDSEKAWKTEGIIRINQNL